MSSTFDSDSTSVLYEVIPSCYMNQNYYWNDPCAVCE